MIRGRDAAGSGALFAIVLTVSAFGCARDRETEVPNPPHVQPTYRFPVTPRPQPTPSMTAPTTSAPPAPSAPPPLPPAALPEQKVDVADLYRAQDACLSSCDQFACMKIANAYKHGTGVPTDVLAGRRYAIHACLECGKPGPGIADQCPEYHLSPEPKPK